MHIDCKSGGRNHPRRVIESTVMVLGDKGGGTSLWLSHKQQQRPNGSVEGVGEQQQKQLGT